MQLKKITGDIVFAVNYSFSSAWSEQLIKDLKSRPTYLSDENYCGSTNCEACNRKSHPASFKVMLSNEEDDATYYMGRYCAPRTEIYHSLYHFKSQLLAELTTKFNKIKMEIQPVGKISYENFMKIEEQLINESGLEETWLSTLEALLDEAKKLQVNENRKDDLY